MKKIILIYSGKNKYFSIKNCIIKGGNKNEKR